MGTDKRVRIGRWLAGGCGIALALAACIGEIGGSDAPTGPTAEVLNEVGVSGARRLTAAEYDTVVYDLLGVVVNSETALPEDLRSPFDNDFTKQEASEALITATESLAGEIAAEVVATPSLREAIVPCTPSGPSDEACFRDFVTQFGRRALRRPLTGEEVTRFVGFLDHAIEADDFWIAVDSALRAFLQHPHFLYRIEIGTPIESQPGVARLSDHELATRLAFTFLGTTPPNWLLDEAANGTLSTPDGVRKVAARLLEEEQALPQIARFHGMWLGYERLPHAPDLAADMELETSKLLERIILERKDAWREVITSEETYLTPALAEHYDMPVPSSEGWVSYGDSGRKGLLSQGSFLSAVAKFEETSPVQRGLLIRARLFCQHIEPPPPDLGVDIDAPPMASDPNACKTERYNMYQQDGCKVCHSQLEPVGFGLENFDSAGRYRTVEPTRPECEITGEGELAGVGTFTGPAELADLLLEAGDVDRCVATYTVRYAFGRYDLEGEDRNFIGRVLEASSDEEGMHFDRLLVEMVSAEAFRHRREEEVSP